MLSVIFPIYNEAENIPHLFERVVPILNGLGMKYEIIFVNDASKDHSLQVLKKIRDEGHPFVKILSFSRNFGHTAALTAGMAHAAGRAVVMMDSDLQHPPELIPQMIEKWKQGFDNVYAIRESYQKEGLLKKCTSSFYYKVLKFLAGVNFPENVADFRLLDAKVVAAYNKEIHEKKRYMRGLIFWLGFKQTHVSYVAPPRLYGETSYTFKKMLSLALNGITSFTNRPLFLGLYFSIAFLAMAFIYGLWIILAKYYFHSTVPGWTSIIWLMILIAAMQFAILGIFGLYLGHLFEEIKNRPLYIIDEKTGFDHI